MSERELDRAEVIRRVVGRELRQAKAAKLLGLTSRQVRRLCVAFKKDGPAGLASLKRGRPSNRKLPQALEEHAIAVVRERYADFGPTLALEKLAEHHDVRVARETLRKWMVTAGLWVPRADRQTRVFQPRPRRDCYGELIQIDGCKHWWFEGRGPQCTMLVFVDDATGKLMELRFVQVESAFDYFASTKAYLERHGRPLAFYSDKHSIFRVTQPGATGRSKGVSQFGRALAELNIDIICANSPQAKGRVERVHQTLQDRLVKELRLRGISNAEDGNKFLPTFREDYNQRFSHPPKNARDAHRPLQADKCLSQIFSWQEERILSRNLVLNYKRATYVVEPNSETIPLGRKKVRIHEWEDGRVELVCEGKTLPYSIFADHGHPAHGSIVDNKRLDSALAAIRLVQAERAEVLLEKKGLTLREKERIRAAQASVPQPALSSVENASLAPVAAFLRRFDEEQNERHRLASQKAKERRSRKLIQPKAAP